MQDLTISERLNALIDVIFSSPFFIILFSFMVLTAITFTVYSATKSKASKIILTISYALSLSFLLIKYGKLILELFDTFIDQIFVAIYFPNLITYVCMVVITSLLMIATIISKKFKKFIRICNILAFTIIEFLFVLTIDLISKSNISLFDKTILYSNQTLMILIQASMAVFACWVGLLIVNLVISLVNLKVPNTVIEINPLKKEELEYLSDEDYYNGFINYNRKKQYQEYSNISKR